MNQPDMPIYRFGPFRYDSGQRLLFRGDERVPLVPKVAETLQVLLEHHGRVVDKAELMKAVWPDATVEEIGLARNISLLRKALGDEGDAGRYIETLPKRGYRFVGELLPALPESAGSQPATEIRPAGRVRRRLWLSAAILIVILCGFVYWQFYRPSRYLPAGEDFANIAVVPFTCLSPELDCGTFPRGLTELLAADLSKLRNIHVISPRTVESYQRARLSMGFMSRLLGLEMLLEGTIQRAGERVRITSRLVDVHSGKLIWSDSYEYPMTNLADVQSQAAREITAHVDAHLAIQRHL